MKELIRKSELSRLESVSRARVTQWVKEGIISEEPSGLLDRKRVSEQLQEWRERRLRRVSESFKGQKFEGIDIGDIGAAIADFVNSERSPGVKGTLLLPP